MPKLAKQDKTPIKRYSFLMREDIREKVSAYGDYLDSNDPATPDYVVSEGLNALFGSDKDFTEFWEKNKSSYRASVQDVKKGRPTAKKVGA